MRYKVYRGLDKPSAFFGIRGRFIRLMALFLGGGLLLALMFGRFTGGLVAIIIILASGFAGFMFIQTLQGRMSERAFARRLGRRRMPKRLRIRSSVGAMMKRRAEPC